MQFCSWRSRRAKKGAHSILSRKPRSQYQRRLLTIESLEARRPLDAGIGILLLDHTQLGALYSSGSGGVHVLGGGSLVIDSTNHKAAVDVGSGKITAAQI
jgi:hypothetical protein